MIVYTINFYFFLFLQYIQMMKNIVVIISICIILFAVLIYFTRLKCKQENYGLYVQNYKKPSVSHKPDGYIPYLIDIIGDIGWFNTQLFRRGRSQDGMARWILLSAA